jgi:hypothetical protein
LAAGVCTHFSKWNHNAIKAASCKSYADEVACTNRDVLGNQQGRHVQVSTGSDCESPGVLVHSDVSTTFTADTCATLCFGHYADYFSVGNSDSFCYCYTGFCAHVGVDTTKSLYSLENICYWTTPLEVHADSDCANSAESTMNAGLSQPTTQLTFSTNWDIQSCHYECQENSRRNFASTAVAVT